MNNDPPLVGANEQDTMPSMLTCASAGNEGDTYASLYQHQGGLKVLDLGHDPHGHMQRVEQIDNMPAAAWASLPRVVRLSSYR
jgi:hypothetical protein